MFRCRLAAQPEAMTIRIQPAEVRGAWSLGAAEAKTDLDNTGRDLSAAQGDDMGELADDLSYAVTRPRGVTTTTSTVIGAFKTNVESCLTTYENTDQTSAGSFRALTPPTP